MTNEKKKTSKMKKVLIGTGVLLMIGSCSAILSDEEQETSEVAQVEESNELAEMREEQAKQQEEHDKREAEKSAEEASEEESVEEEEVEEAVDEIETEAPEVEEDLTQAEAEQQFLTLLETSMGDIADIEFNEANKMYRVTPTDPAMKDAINMIVQGYLHDEFMEIQYSMETLSTNAMGIVGEGYTLTMVNPHNTERDLIVVLDGTTIYNAVTEMQQ